MKDILSRPARDIFGPLKSFQDRLLGNCGEYWWKAFSRFLRKEDPFRIRPEDAWISTSLPISSNADLMVICEAKKMLITQWAKSLCLQHQLHTSHVEDVTFVRGTTCELFGIEGGWQSEYLNEAFLKRFGLGFCKASDAFFIRSCYVEQSKGEYLHVVSAPLAGDFSAQEHIFTVGNHPENGLQVHIDVFGTGPKCRCSSYGVDWVFRLLPDGQ